MKNFIDYHDFIFEDGRFLGKFEEMYKFSTNIPWRQDKRAFSVSSNIDIEILRQYHYNNICDIGCGLGYFSNRLYEELVLPGGRRPSVTGVDISESAIKKARKSFSGCHFISADICKKVPARMKLMDLAVVKDLMWYILNDRIKFLKNVMAIVKEGGFIYFSQSFPGTKKWFGQDIISGPEQLKDIVSEYIDPIHYCLDLHRDYSGGPIVHILGTKIS